MNKRYSVKLKQLPLQTPVVAALLLAFVPLAAVGQAIPGAGMILQEIKPVQPALPSASGTALTIQQEGGARLPPSAPFPVKSIRISGNTVFDTATLHALLTEAEGKSLTLQQLDALASRISDYYHAHGYPLARALIPAQTIATGIVRIDILEAHYGKITLDNHSRVNDPLLLATLAPLQGGQAIQQARLDHALLLLSDMPGVVVNATLKPGQGVGSSDLLVDTTSGPALTGNVALDNDGNRYTGRARVGATFNFIDPLRHGDILSVSGLSSGSGMNYGRLSYEALLTGQGTRLGGSWSALRYSLGQPLAALDAHGSAEVASLWARHPLRRSRDANLYGQIQYDGLQLRDHVDANALRTDRQLKNWTASLSGDARDSLLSGGASAWNLGLTRGRVGFDDASAQLADAATARTEGSFSKWNANLVRLQNLGSANSVYLSVSGQWANGNLDASQKMVAGGPYSVRAYDMGALSGDTGATATAELRHELGAAWNGQWQVLAFIDSAHLTINKTPWVAGANSATLSGAGLGLSWAGPNRWSARTYVAAPFGTRPALVAGSASVRAWVEIGRGF